MTDKTAGESEDDLQEVEGPDPRHWPSHAPELWGLVLDLEYLRRAKAVLDGPVHPELIQANANLLRFIRESEDQLRTDLVGAFAAAYGFTVDTPESSRQFPDAGKPRAFAAERPPDPAAP